jgi:hypothetical protein
MGLCSAHTGLMYLLGNGIHVNVFFSAYKYSNLLGFTNVSEAVVRGCVETQGRGVSARMAEV